MDISDIVSAEYDSFDADTRVSELEGAIRESGDKAVVVTEDGEYEGLVTQRQLIGGHRNPDAKARGLVWHVAKVDADEDVRTVARLMVGSDAKALPVFEDEELVGVVTADDLLAKVQPFLRVLTVDAVSTPDLLTVPRDATLGETLHTLREQRITHLPVVEDDAAVGIVGLADVLDFAAREMRRGQGGSPAAEVQTGGGRSHGGFGERSGDLDRMLDLPVENVMSEPIATTTPKTGLDEAVGTMLSRGISSLVVTDGGRPAGIVTKTDVLEALSVTEETQFPVQITHIDLLDDMTRADVARLIEGVTRKYGGLKVLEANVFLHEHDETLRGTPLVMARIRLFTDKGHFVGTGEGYGARHALHLARNVVERQILEGKDYARTKKHPSEDYWNKVFGWWLTGSPRR
ncbi:CBS domain-containing protein [Haloarcula nitratireducens]|uniref:CBS domain-containing protein n=1 Tax=Haloarcula nitratireducens TaxID=2487749 RepID=A0AAW4PE89_9EURY|nr:CBS domain-containing protein [Halomicroarcula nitratireducens]MBX0296251.1 CBS domain-containing protein [Halomicroarcula nitratireducens]